MPTIHQGRHNAQVGPTEILRKYRQLNFQRIYVYVDETETESGAQPACSSVVKFEGEAKSE